MTGVFFAVAVVLTVMALRPHRVQPGPYLREVAAPSPRQHRPSMIPAGMVWGIGVGWLVGNATGRTFSMTILGAAAGGLGARATASTRRERRARRLLQELPTVADTLALYVLAGDSITGAIRKTVERCEGVAASELREALADDAGLEAGLRRAAAASSSPEAGRMYELLAHAHRTGGRLAEALSELAIDFRAGIITSLTAEGGRRALASYGPILAFMIPVTLVFLMYPTLAGLSALSARP